MSEAASAARIERPWPPAPNTKVRAEAENEDRTIHPNLVDLVWEYWLDGCSTAEIATRHGIPESRVYRHLLVARGRYGKARP